MTRFTIQYKFLICCVQQIRRTHTIRVVSNQARRFYDVPRVSIVTPCDFRVWAPSWCGSRTVGLDLKQQASTLCSRHCWHGNESTNNDVIHVLFAVLFGHRRFRTLISPSLFAVFLKASNVVLIFFNQALANMSKATYQNIRKLCSTVFSRKQTLQFDMSSIPGCDVSTGLLFSEDSTSLCVQSCQTRPIYSLQVQTFDNMNAGQLLNCDSDVQNYEIMTMSTCLFLDYPIF